MVHKIYGDLTGRLKGFEAKSRVEECINRQFYLPTHLQFYWAFNRPTNLFSGNTRPGLLICTVKPVILFLYP